MAGRASWITLICIIFVFQVCGCWASMASDKQDSTSSKDDGKSNDKPCDPIVEKCEVKLVTEAELASKTGENGGKELWLSILGKVYDVSRGEEYYAPGSGYHIFAGKDGTVPFITGNFTDEEAKKSSDELTAAQLYAVEREWGSFYAKQDKYPFVGYLVGRFYDGHGNPTEELLRIQDRVKGYEKIKEAKDREKRERRQKKFMGMMSGGMAENIDMLKKSDQEL